MKKFLIGIMVFAVLVGIGFAVVFNLTSDIVEVAEDFFQGVHDGDLARAEALLSEDFKASTSSAELRQFLDQTALSDYTSASWSSRSVSGSTGELEGSVETESGGTIPVKIAFVKEAAGWKIQNIEKDAAGLTHRSQARSIPTDAEVEQMVGASMQELAMAINNREFSTFYGNVAKLWQAQTSAEALATGFASFSDQNIDLTVLRDMDPIFSEPPRIDEETSVLKAKGYYSTHPSVTYFDLDYIYEHPDWRLAGVDVNVR